jgi:hypothetical protein
LSAALVAAGDIDGVVDAGGAAVVEGHRQRGESVDVETAVGVGGEVVDAGVRPSGIGAPQAEEAFLGLHGGAIGEGLGEVGETLPLSAVGRKGIDVGAIGLCPAVGGGDIGEVAPATIRRSPTIPAKGAETPRVSG